MVKRGFLRFWSGGATILFFSCSSRATLWISLWLSESRPADSRKLREHGVQIVLRASAEVIDVEKIRIGDDCRAACANPAARDQPVIADRASPGEASR